MAKHASEPGVDQSQQMVIVRVVSKVWCHPKAPQRHHDVYKETIIIIIIIIVLNKKFSAVVETL